MESITLAIDPVPAPRMTRSDTWKTDPNHRDPKKRQRPCVARYFTFRDELAWSLKVYQYKLGGQLDIVFHLPMPSSWSKKKRDQMFCTAHQVRPDLDNLVKGFMDALSSEDGFVWSIKAKKLWNYTGMIQINI